jgi:hypothetical protein
VNRPAGAILAGMTVTTSRVERSGPAIRAALAASSPEDREQFETEFQQAVAEAGRTFDLAAVQAVLDRWWGVAALRANPLSEQERQLLTGARAGDDAGWLARDQDGRWAQR